MIADFYGANCDAYTNRPGQPSYGDDDPGQVSGQRLWIHLDIFAKFSRGACDDPCIQGAGRLDTGVPTFGQASAWGSLLPAVWSFMLALQERGLGSAWTTLHLPNEREVAG